MKLGIFDSGLGGLIITRAVRERIPDIDIFYFGDTMHLPYGNRSEEAIYMYTQRAVEAMFGQGCKLVVTACNTASVSALRRLQQEWLPKRYGRERNIIGVVVPTLEAAIERGYKTLGLIATAHSIKSNAYEIELKKIDPSIRIVQKATPLLVPLIENDGMEWAEPVLRHYLEPMLEQGIECLILGCTHYAFLKPHIRKIVGDKVAVLSQDEIIPAKLEDYLGRHPEYNSMIGRSGKTDFSVSDLSENYQNAAWAIYGSQIDIQAFTA